MNAKSISRQRRINPNDQEYFWLAHPHLLIFKQSLKLKFYCDFHFTKFPFDEHTCELKYTTISASINIVKLLPIKIHYGNTKNEIKTCIDVHQDALPFEILLHGNLENEFLSIDGLTYPVARINIDFRRNTFGLLVGTFYIPTSLFAILSLISFSIEIDMVSIKRWR